MKIPLIVFNLLMAFVLPAQNFLWARQIAGVQTGSFTGQSSAASVKPDAVGNLFVSGSFYGTVDFDTGPGTYTLSDSGNCNLFVAKYDALANLIWAKKFGGQGSGKMSLDHAENILLAGLMTGTVDFDTGPGTYTLSAGNGTALTVQKADINGNFMWAGNLTGAGQNQIRAIIAGPSNEVFISGQFNDTLDCDPGPLSYPLTCSMNVNGFNCQLDSNGNFVWASSVSGSNSYVNDNIIDPSGAFLCAGYCSAGSNFDPGVTNFTVNSGGGFYARYDNTGNFLSVKVIGGCDISTIHYTNQNNLVLSGIFQGNVDFDPGPAAYTLSSIGAQGDLFISKFNNQGSPQWVHQIVRSTGGEILEMASDFNGNIYTCGYFISGTDFNPGPNSYSVSSPTSPYIFKLDAQGGFNSLWYAAGLQLSSAGIAWSLARDNFGSVFAAGQFGGAGLNFDPGNTNYALAPIGNFNAFIVKLGSNAAAGLNELRLKQNEISLYPNPSTGKITVLCETGEMKIFSPTGALIKSCFLTEGKNEIDLSSLTPGIYFAETRSDAEIKRIKIIRE